MIYNTTFMLYWQRPLQAQANVEEDNIKIADLLVKFFEKSLGYLEMKIIGKILSPGVGAREDILKKEELSEKGCQLGKRISKFRK